MSLGKRVSATDQAMAAVIFSNDSTYIIGFEILVISHSDEYPIDARLHLFDND